MFARKAHSSEEMTANEGNSNAASLFFVEMDGTKVQTKDDT